MREEVEGLNRALKRMFHMIKTLRNDQMRAIGTTKGLLCLSCGSKDVNFPPPQRYVRKTESSDREIMGGDGNYYQTDITKSNRATPGPDFEYGKDVFTKEQLVKEDVIKRHIPVDLILGMDIDDMHMGSILPRQNMNRPLTGSYASGKRAGSAIPTKTSTNFRPSN